MRITPIAEREINANNIDPLDLRRKRAVLDGVERYRSFETDHPNRVRVDSWTTKDYNKTPQGYSEQTRRVPPPPTRWAPAEEII